MKLTLVDRAYFIYCLKAPKLPSPPVPASIPSRPAPTVVELQGFPLPAPDYPQFHTTAAGTALGGYHQYGAGLIENQPGLSVQTGGNLSTFGYSSSQTAGAHQLMHFGNKRTCAACGTDTRNTSFPVTRQFCAKSWTFVGVAITGYL